MEPSTTDHDMDMDTFDGGDSNFYALPPHIAARFYRKTRRSSAHSSRRSSLSSLHSRHSTLSAHGGPQSNHVAQHLRRASIIENRKARLADRAAHAEQVRLRAAIAKALPRGSYREERALAAQATREKLLADIAARCEEEVRRAKRIAEETKQKKAAEHIRLQEEMAEKLAEAERRRSLYQRSSRRPRTVSLPPVEEKKFNTVQLQRLSLDAAAKVIQRQWRFGKLRQAVAAFIDIGLSLHHVQNMPFEQLGRRLSEDSVLCVTTTLLKKLRLLELGSAGEEDRGVTRIFLSIYLILGHPIQALSNGGKDPQEQDLMSKAQDLLCSFDIVLARYQTPTRLTKRTRRHVPAGHSSGLSKEATASSDVEELSFYLNNFICAFHAWKTRDSSTLIDIMINQFVELDLILQTVKDDQAGGVAEDYFQAIRNNQIQLLARLKKFAGPDVALSRVKSAVRKARKRRGPKPSVISQEHVPRSSAVSDPPPKSEAPTSSLSAGKTDQHGHLDTGLGASSFVNRLGQTMTVLPSNREISHEMLINGTYEIQQQPWTDSKKILVDSLRSSMRLSMNQESTTNTSNWTYAMAILIREKVLNLISRKHPLYEGIDGFLDLQLIDQQCRAGMFSYDSFFESIAGLIAQICSPGRDGAIKAFRVDSKSDTIDRLFNLINIIDLMTLDHLNFSFRAATPLVIEHGHEHERSAFERDLANGVHALDMAKRWWTMARSNLIDSPSGPPPQGNSIYTRGLVDLVLSNAHLSHSDLPETLRLDWARLLSLRARTLKLVAISSILLTTKIRLRRNREAQWTRDAERLMALDFTLPTKSNHDAPATADLFSTLAARILSTIESSHMMPDATKEGLFNFITRVLPPAVASARNAASTSTISSSSPQSISTDDIFTEQISTFVLKALRAHVYTRLSAASTVERVRATTSAAETLARAGMPESVAEVAGLVDVLERVKKVDLKSHEGWWVRISEEVEGEAPAE